MSSTASAAGQHEVFISYVSEDQELCLHVTDFLCHIGVSYYVDFDPNKIRPGGRIASGQTLGGKGERCRAGGGTWRRVG